MPTPKRSPEGRVDASHAGGHGQPPPDGPVPGTAASSAAALRRERERVADALHNTLCQELTGICLMASAAAGEFRQVCPEAEARLKEIAGLIQRAGVSLQEFTNTLRTPESRE